MLYFNRTSTKSYYFFLPITLLTTIAIIKQPATIANINIKFIFLLSPVAGDVTANIDSIFNKFVITKNPLSKIATDFNIHIIL